MRSWQAVIVLVVLSGCLAFASGCASEQRADPDDSIESIERPAVSLEDEETTSDKVGEVGVVMLVVGSALAALALPLLLLGGL